MSATGATGSAEGVEASLRAALAANEASERALLERHARFVEASQDSNADDEHDPEGATIAFERSQVDALVRRTRLRVAEVDAALARLAD